MCVGFSFLITSVVAGPASVGLTTIAGRPAITIKKLFGKKKKVYYLQDLGPHSEVSGRELGSLVLVLLGLRVGAYGLTLYW